MDPASHHGVVHKPWIIEVVQRIALAAGTLTQQSATGLGESYNPSILTGLSKSAEQGSVVDTLSRPMYAVHNPY